MKLIAALAAEKGLKKRAGRVRTRIGGYFKADSFNNLVTRGFIRIVKTEEKNAAVRTSGAAEEIIVPVPAEHPAENEKYGAYADTLASSENLVSRHGAYSEILSALAAGCGTARFSEKLMLRSIDEMWVSAIERCLPALDELIRKPARYIAETEEVLPIELTKRVSGRSVAHLARHTDYISRNEYGELTPTKLLNVFREDSLLTYENKFLNTLISRLYLFIGKRAKIAEEAGADEKLENFEFESAFEHGEGRGRIKIEVEYSERNTEETARKPFLGTGLWHRVQRLNEIVSGYMQSSFVKAMDKNYIRPPVMRTNAILKNKYFNECLALWEFIESYEDAGYGITVSETVKDVPDEYVKEIYALAAQNYLVFLHNAGKPVKDAAEYEYSAAPRSEGGNRYRARGSERGIPRVFARLYGGKRRNRVRAGRGTSGGRSGGADVGIVRNAVCKNVLFEDPHGAARAEREIRADCQRAFEIRQSEDARKQAVRFVSCGQNDSGARNGERKGAESVFCGSGKRGGQHAAGRRSAV